VDPLWAELINSDWHDHRGSGRRADRIDDDRWLAAFLARTGWLGRRLLGEKDRRRLRTLRGLLRRAVDTLRPEDVLADREIAALNRALAACPEVRRLERQAGDSLALVLAPAAVGIERVLGAVAASFAEFVAHGEASRIRVCANADCRWVFVDSSRNRTRRWCEAKVCGSLINVRRLRARRRSPRAHSRPA